MMISHAYAPGGFCQSTLIPIPKNKRKSLNDSTNYRAIALSSIMGKLLDRIILTKCHDVFLTSSFQYGFKKHHSTTQCSFVANEIINYYEKNGSDVYCILLDASQAFDRVYYIKLFEILLNRHVCPLLIRFLLAFYTSQMICVKWGNKISDHYSVRNGVKQGGVLSPVLFIMYIDELLVRLSKSKLGCHIGNSFCGALGYADDVVLLSPSITSAKAMLHICSEFASDYNVLFNCSKSKMLCFGKSKYVGQGLDFMGGIVSIINTDKHLGHPIGRDSNKTSIDDAINDLYCKTNMIMSHFSYVDFDVKYKLFKSFCMPLYGCVLWNYFSRDIQRFYTAWRKCIRRIIGVPYKTHCNLLHLIVEDLDISTQLLNRCSKFIKSIIDSNNHLSNLCLQLAANGSRSNLGLTISYMSHAFNIPRYDIYMYGTKPRISTRGEKSQQLTDTAYVIRDMLNMLHLSDYSLLERNDVVYLLEFLCIK